MEGKYLLNYQQNWKSNKYFSYIRLHGDISEFKEQRNYNPGQKHASYPPS